jgi:hypothetical protein
VKFAVASSDVSSSDSPKPSSKMNRRGALKVGALGVAGVAGVLAASQVGGLATRGASAYSSQASSKNGLADLLSALVDQGIVEPFNSVTFFHVPPNSTVTVNQKVPAGFVSFITQDRVTVAQDHSLQMSIFIDGREILVDPDMVQARYIQPLNFLSSSSFYPIGESFKVVLTNKTSRPKYYSSMQTGGKISLEQWNSIMRLHLAGIAAIGGM